MVATHEEHPIGSGGPAAQTSCGHMSPEPVDAALVTALDPDPTLDAAPVAVVVALPVADVVVVVLPVELVVIALVDTPCPPPLQSSPPAPVGLKRRGPGSEEQASTAAITAKSESPTVQWFGNEMSRRIA